MYVEWWHTWQTFGALPYPGDFYDQPPRVCAAFWVCESAQVNTQPEIHPDG